MTTKRKVGVILSSSQKEKRYIGSSLASAMLSDSPHDFRIPCSVMAVNWITGGGIPYGKIMEIYGEESSGKTLLAMDFGKSVQKLGGILLWNDAEQAFTPAWSLKNGLDLNRIEFYNETMVEYVSDWLLDMAVTYRSRFRNNEPILFIQDSIAALDTESNISSAHIGASAEMGNRAKAIYKMIRTRNEQLYELGVTSIYINQIRKMISASKWQDPDTTPGGQAMRFYAAIRLGLYAGKQIRDKIDGRDELLGRNVSIRIKKNKVAPPRPTLKGMEVIFNDLAGEIGFKRYINLPDILVKEGVLEKKPRSPVFYYEGDVIARGESGLLKLLESDKDIRRKILRKAGINTISSLRRKLERTEVNHFAINAKKIRNDETISEEEDNDN